MNKNVSQIELFEPTEVPRITLSSSPSKRRTGAFTDNMRLPVHRWFRYSAGFSAAWAESVITDRLQGQPKGLVFDPFAGSGTTLLAAQATGRPAVGAEHHSFVYRVAVAKQQWRRCDLTFLKIGSQLLNDARKAELSTVETQSELLKKCYAPQVLCRLEALKRTYESKYARNINGELLWLAITAILRECSHAGTAQWQYVLPTKTKARVVDPYKAFELRIAMFHADASQIQKDVQEAPNEVLFVDSRSRENLSALTGKVDLVLTSPPYPNNYDYADATRLEMTFWGEISGWGDLQKAVRHRLIRSCSQHASAERLNLDVLLDDPAVEPIRKELADVTQQLAAIKETKGGKKAYDTMIAAYFADIARVWQSIDAVCTSSASVCFVIGDSAPYGIYVPVDRWMIVLAEAANFNQSSFEKIRDRNTKWKNRKHTVPLKEGNLWVAR